jgi:putative spermidine/putrescine transport system substrate-binding protein
MTRKTTQLLCVLGAAAVSALLAAPPAQAKELRIMAWQGYADDDWVQEFEEKTGADVEVAFIASDDEIWAKMMGSEGKDFDIFAVNSAQLQRYIDAGLTTPIDLAAIPNQPATLPRFNDLTKVQGITRDGKVHAIPFAFDASGGLIYDKGKVQPTPTSMSILWDPKYQGKVLAYDNGEYNFSFTALVMGFPDPFNLTPEQYEQIKAKLIALKSNVLTFYTNMDDGTQIYQNNDVALIWANFGRLQVKAMEAAGANIGYIIPDEGALAWLDTWALTSGVKEKELAEQWINFLLEKRISAAMSERTGYGNTVTETDVANPDDKLIYVEPVENPTMRSDLWNEIKAAP